MCFGIENEVVDMFPGRRLHMVLKWSVLRFGYLFKGLLHQCGYFLLRLSLKWTVPRNSARPFLLSFSNRISTKGLLSVCR